MFQKLGEEEKEHLATLEQRYAELIATDPLLESRPTFLFFKGAASGVFAEGTERAARGGRRRAGAAHRDQLRARIAPVLQALRRALRGLRGQAVFLEFADEERAHLELLIREYRALRARRRRAGRRGGRAAPLRRARRPRDARSARR